MVGLKQRIDLLGKRKEYQNKEISGLTKNMKYYQSFLSFEDDMDETNSSESSSLNLTSEDGLPENSAKEDNSQNN